MPNHSTVIIMKKLLLLYSLLFLVISGSLAQIQLGARAGLNLSNQTQVYGLPNNRGQIQYHSGQQVSGFQGGAIFLEQKISPLFWIRAQLIYSNQGSKTPEVVDYSGTDLVVASSTRLHYLNLPLQVLFSPSFRWGRPWLGLGPYFGYLLSGKITDNGGNSYPLGISGNNSPYQHFDVGVTATAGMQLKWGLMAGIDYQYGLLNNSGSSSAYGNTAGKMKNRVLGLYLGYMWTLRKPDKSGK